MHLTHLILALGHTNESKWVLWCTKRSHLLTTVAIQMSFTISAVTKSWLPLVDRSQRALHWASVTVCPFGIGRWSNDDNYCWRSSGFGASAPHAKGIGQSSLQSHRVLSECIEFTRVYSKQCFEMSLYVHPGARRQHAQGFSPIHLRIPGNRSYARCAITMCTCR